MKKIILTLGFIVAMATFVNAQWELKLQAGVNTSHLTTEHVDWTQQGRIGYQFGASVLVGEKFYVEPGILWAQTSKDLFDRNDENATALKTSINTIRIPVFLGYHLLGNEESLADLRIFAGPSGSFITGISSDADIAKEDFKNFIFDLDTGVAIDVWFLFLEWHYVFGLTPVFNEGSDAKLQAFYGNLGVRIRF
jgi:hypothetical protein